MVTRFSILKARIACLIVAPALLTLPGVAVEILGTDFTDRTVDFEVASDIQWRTAGVAAPGDLTVVDTDDTGLLAGLFDTDAALDAFAVDLNIHNEGPWHVDIPITVLAEDISLVSLDVGLGIFNNGGALQGQNRDADVTVTVFDDGGNEVSTGEGLDTFPNQGGIVENPAPVSIQLDPITLAAGQEYVLRLFVSGEGPGNNAGFDFISLQGTIGGEAADPLIASSDTSLALGRLPAFPVTANTTFSLSNMGASKTLTITGIEVTGDSAANFTVGEFPPSLAPDESGDVTVQFNSNGESADFRANLVISSDSVVNPQLTIVVSALVDAPDGDSDGDGLTDEQEAEAGSDPFLTDTDGDQLSDADEVNEHKTDPTLPDTDGDGFADGSEIESGTDPTDKDSFPAIVLFTDFVDRVIDELTASDFAWIVDGVADPGPLTAVDTEDTGILFELFDTDNAQNAFAPDMNLHNEGPWHVDVPMNVTAANLSISRIELGVGIFNNGGNLQGVSRDVDVTVTIFDAEENDLATGEALDIFEADGAFEENPTLVEVALSESPLILSGGEYTMRIAFSGEGPGNNAGLTSISVEGGSSGAGRGFAFTRIARGIVDDKDVVDLEWNSLPGASYGLDSSADLQNWIEEQDGLASDGTTTAFRLDGPFDAERYFRVRRE